MIKSTKLGRCVCVQALWCMYHRSPAGPGTHLGVTVQLAIRAPGDSTLVDPTFILPQRSLQPLLWSPDHRSSPANLAVRLSLHVSLISRIILLETGADHSSVRCVVLVLIPSRILWNRTSSIIWNIVKIKFSTAYNKMKWINITSKRLNFFKVISHSVF